MLQFLSEVQTKDELERHGTQEKYAFCTWGECPLLIAGNVSAKSFSG